MLTEIGLLALVHLRQMDGEVVEQTNMEGDAEECREAEQVERRH